MTDEGGVESYRGVNVRKYPNGPITMSQLAIIDKILNCLEVFDESKIHDTPANVILNNDKDGNGGNPE